MNRIKKTTERIGVDNNEFPWTEQLEHALFLLLHGINCFITGPGGVGKSLLIKVFCEMTDKVVMLCAPTACAANIINGVTAHRAFSMEKKVLPPDEEPKRSAIDRLSNYDVVIIDEVSMLRMDYFIYFFKLLRAAEELKGSKIQVVLVGDFFQLPPVITRTDRSLFASYYRSRDGYAFETPEWNWLGLAPVILTENIRQDIWNDPASTKHLQYIRKCKYERTKRKCADYFNRRAKRDISDDVLRLYPRRHGANEHNRKKLDELLNRTGGEEKTYTAILDEGVKKDDEFPVDRKIKLAVGARIMTRANVNGSFYNGEMGTVTELYEDHIVALMDTGDEVSIWRYPFEITDYNEDRIVTRVGTLKQLPVTLAYAITIHKSQGMTLNAVAIDPACFADGQLYVALSRVKDMENLYLIDYIRPEHIKVSENVEAFYERLEHQAEQVLSRYF